MRLTVIIILTLALFLFEVAHAATIHVPGDFHKIQLAIDAAEDGDRVLVGPGTYTENIDFLGKKIIVRSKQGPHLTVIDGMRKDWVITFHGGEKSDSVIDGFTLTNGYAQYYSGGGISIRYFSSPTIQNNIISGNEATNGAGIRCWERCTPMIRNNLIIDNHAYHGGGGISSQYSDLVIVHNVIAENSADTGGGITYASGNPTIANNIICNNIAAGLNSKGGGICCGWGGYPKIMNNLIYGNTAIDGDKETGGGIFIACEPYFVNNAVVGNKAGKGGGLYCYFFDISVHNNIICDNEASIGSEIYLGDRDFTANSRLAIHYSNVANDAQSIYVKPGCFLFYDPSNIDADPFFVDSANHDYHLTFDSPCRDAGMNSVVSELYDFEGDPRLAHGTVDMGADEFYTHLYYTGDSTPGGEIEGKLIGLPGTYPTGLWFGLSGVLNPPIQTKYGLWHLNHPWIQVYPIKPIPGNGVLVIPARISSYPAPYDIPMQGLVGLNSDSLTNLCVLEVR